MKSIIFSMVLLTSGHFLYAQNVGIGTETPLHKLDVHGAIHSTTNVIVDGNLTVNSGKGVIRNTHGSAQLKYYTIEVGFSAGIGGHALSAAGSFNIAGGGFLTAPAVMAADIVSVANGTGQYFRVLPIIYGCTTTTCNIRLLNTSPNAISYSTTWNIVCIGN